MAEWDRVFAVNVRGLFQVTRAAVPLLQEGHEAPAIVNTASIVGLRPGPQPLPYAASKAAVVNLTKTLAWNLGPEIRVNAVAPGWMEGDWMQRMLGDKYEDLMGKRAKATPLKRCVTADDVAETMLEPDPGQPLRHRRDRRHRRRLHQLDLRMSRMLDGFVPFPPEFARRYREQGYWRDRPLAQELGEVVRAATPSAPR